MILRAVEIVRHQLSVAVRVLDHFTSEPLPAEVDVELDTMERPTRTRDDRSRHSDGTYRFVDLVAGPRVLRVGSPTYFTWAPTTAFTLPIFDPAVDPAINAVMEIEVWPTANATVPAGTLAIRGRLEAPAPAAPVAANQVVEMEVIGTAPMFPPRNRKTRIDAQREFLFPIVGPVKLDANAAVPIKVVIPGRTVDSIEIREPATVTTFSTDVFTAPPGRELRVVINLS